MQKETHKFHIGIKLYKKKDICEKTILLKSVGLSGFIYVETVRFIIDFLSVAPQPMQITFFHAHDDHVMCVVILHISSYYTALQSRKTSLKVKNGLLV